MGLLYAVLGQLLIAARASPCNNNCNADNCLRAVRASSHFPYPSSASADCSSFLRRTVTPCLATTTSTVVVTNTNALVLVTDTTTVDVTDIVTSTDNVISVVSTIDFTITTTLSSIPVETVADLIRPFPTVARLVGAAERREDDGIAKRSTSCAATTNSATKVPPYASACSGTARYSSACSCDGVRATTTSLPQQTVTVTTTTTVQVTPTSTVIALITSDMLSTLVLTNIISSTFSNTITSTYTLPSAPTVEPTDPQFVGLWEYVGCVGSVSDFPTFELVESSSAMEPEVCTLQCQANQATYAGLYRNNCYCALTLDPGTGTEYNNGQSCRIPCGGDPTQACGEDSIFPRRKRQAINELFSVYIYIGPPYSSTGQ